MGRGNWFPGNSLGDCEVVYAELDSNDDDGQYHWQEFRLFLVSCLPKSWMEHSIFDRRYVNDRLTAWAGMTRLSPTTDCSVFSSMARVTAIMSELVWYAGQTRLPLQSLDCVKQLSAYSIGYKRNTRCPCARRPGPLRSVLWEVGSDDYAN